MQLITQEFIVANLDFLQMAMRELGILYAISTNAEIVSFEGMNINLKNKTIEADRYQMRRVNELKVEYSRQVVKEVAKRKRIVLNHLSKQRMKARKY